MRRGQAGGPVRRLLQWSRWLIGLVTSPAQVRSESRVTLKKELQELANKFYVECERMRRWGLIQVFRCEQLKIWNCYLTKLWELSKGGLGWNIRSLGYTKFEILIIYSMWGVIWARGCTSLLFVEWSGKPWRLTSWLLLSSIKNTDPYCL